MLALLVPAHVCAWVVRFVVVLPLWVIGVPLLFVLAKRHAWEPRRSRFFAYEDGSPRLLAQWRSRVVWLIYGNDEDGIAGPRSFMQGAQIWKRAFVWSAWRNPVNNLRFVYPFGIRIEPRRIRWRGNVVDSPLDDERNELAFLRSVAGDESESLRLRWSYTWQGVFAGLWIRRPGRYPIPRIVWPWKAFRARWPFVEWQRPSLSIRLEQRTLNARCGWKLVPKDARGVPHYDYRSKGCAFGLQFQLRGER